MATRKLYAVFIGVNAYEKARNLNGCIKDVLNADRFFRGLCNQQKGTLEYEPLYFLSPHDSDKAIIEEHGQVEKVSIQYEPPSFKNVTTLAFDHLGKSSNNDVCLFYFSGHGSFINASPEFADTKPTRQSETLVLADSRSTARDLIDKELAYLLYKTLDKKPDVHCLLIMDCCHSGNNSRELESFVSEFIYRQESPSNQDLPLKDYLGYEENFFTRNAIGKLEYAIANYVHMAACRDNELSIDTFGGGLFSKKLMEVLNKGGYRNSYRSIVQGLAATVSIQNGTQNPVAFSINDDNLDRQFLGGQIIPYKPSFEVRYMPGNERWQLQAGSMQGIIPSAGLSKTIVSIGADNVEAEVVHVEDFTALLDGEQLARLNKSENYQAAIKQLAIKRQRIGFSKKLQQHAELAGAIETRFKQSDYVYVELAGNDDKPDFLIDFQRRDGNYRYYLTQVFNDIPLFRSEIDVNIFCDNIDAVGKWTNVKNLESRDSMYTQDDFIFTADVIEGASITENNIDTITGKLSTVKPGEQIDLMYQSGSLPALRFSIEIHPDSKLQECFIQALYLDTLFGIKTDFIEADASRLTKGNKCILKTKANNKLYKLLRFNIPAGLQQYNINEILEQLKIIVSARPNVQLNGYRQPALHAPERMHELESGLTKDISDILFDTEPQSKWAVFNFNVRVMGERKAQPLAANGTTNFSSFSITAPAGFNAIVSTVTQADIPPSARGIQPSASPAVLGDVLADPSPFGDEAGGVSNNRVMALELFPMNGQPLPVLGEGDELVIKVDQNTATTRALEDYDSVTIPYGYDKDSQLYFPIGYEDETGDLHITRLPQADDESLLRKAVTTKSVFGSVKLYFKKLLRRNVNTLALHVYKNDQWNTLTKTDEIKQHIASLPATQNLPIVVHGIFGDTKGIIEGLKMQSDLSTRFPAILSYDYENMKTKVPDTAAELKTALDDVGAGKDGAHKLIVIAHSMGGLVSRWLIEKAGGAPLVAKLIMAGTPNGGSEWSGAGEKILNGANFLLTHALNVAGPIKYAITGISWFIKKFHDPTATLKDMDKESQLINDLNGSKPPAGIPYFIVGGDTGLFREYNDQDEFLLKVKNLLMGKIVFPGLDAALFHQTPNDMAVTLESMQSIPGFTAATQMQILPGDHISYYSDTLTRKAILVLAYS